MSTFGYRKELWKYEEVDEDELLASLSNEELQELERELADLDPDDNVPIGLRQKDQTAKTPSGAFDRDALLRHWEEENQRLGSRSPQASAEERPPEISKVDHMTPTGSGVSRRQDKDKKKVFHSGKKAKTDRSAKEYEEKKDECKKEDKCRNSAQRKACSAQPNASSHRSSVSALEPLQQNLDAASDRPSGNPIVIDRTLEQILSDDPYVSEVNLNNIENISQETLLRFAEALRGNTHVRVFSLANTQADDRVAFAVSKMLQENRSVENLNIESNFVSGQGILALLASLRHNRTLLELRFQNQRHICGGKVEMEMVHLLRENGTLLKLGYQFDLPGPRMAATGILTRNLDQLRQRRLQRREEQAGLEASITPEKHLPASPAVNKPPKKPSQPLKPAKTNEKQTKIPPPPPPPILELLSEKNTATQRIAEMVQLHEGSNRSKSPNQKKLRSKKVKNGANEKESVDILRDLRSSLKSSLQKNRGNVSRPLAPQRSTRDDLLEAIRGSSIRSLKRVSLG